MANHMRHNVFCPILQGQWRERALCLIALAKRELCSVSVGKLRIDNFSGKKYSNTHYFASSVFVAVWKMSPHIWHKILFCVNRVCINVKEQEMALVASVSCHVGSNVIVL